ncbi:MAG: hypothetical protein K6B45_09915 [Bacteroidaceae bacterium]|nr:hypothetical protein [Bacteroidaceae bacterium]
MHFYEKDAPPAVSSPSGHQVPASACSPKHACGKSASLLRHYFKQKQTKRRSFHQTREERQKNQNRPFHRGKIH